MMIYVGTSGFDYREWRGVLYGDGEPRSEYLKTYSRTFSALELNFSYYCMPRAEQLEAMAVRGGQSLLFSIKAHESLTHRITDTWSQSAELFCCALAPLVEKKQLGAVLLQFPFSFHYNAGNRRYLSSLVDAMSPLPLVVEFRNSEWINRRVIDGLRRRKVAICCTDMPALKGLPSALDVVTSPVGYVRFHGRNSDAWWSGDSGDRFSYLYSEKELNGWSVRLQDMAQKAEKLFVFFNNHRRGQAVINGRMLIDMLGLKINV